MTKVQIAFQWTLVAPGAAKGRVKPLRRRFGAQAADAGSSNDLKEIRDDWNLSLDASRSEKQIWFTLDSLCSLPLYVCLTEKVWFSCPVLPSEDCGFLGTQILRFPWRSTDFWRSQPHFQYPKPSFSYSYKILTICRSIKAHNNPDWHTAMNFRRYLFLQVRLPEC